MASACALVVTVALVVCLVPSTSGARTSSPGAPPASAPGVGRLAADEGPAKDAWTPEWPCRGCASPSTVSTSAGSYDASALAVYAGPANVSGVASVNTLLGHRVPMVMDFLDGTSWSTITSPSYFTNAWADQGYQMIWGVPMLPNSGGSLATGATGAYNAYFVTLAQELVAAGQGASVIRLGWEFNGGWFPWAANGQAASFVTYWQQIVDSMRSVAGAAFKFEWNPTRGDLGVGPLSDYYPGNAYVDIVGLDVYDAEWGSYPGAQAEWTHMLTQTYGLDWVASFAAENHKELALPEWGLGWTSGGEVGGGDNAYFVNQMANWIAANHVAIATAWDYGSNPLPASSDPNAEAAFVKDFSG